MPINLFLLNLAMWVMAASAPYDKIGLILGYDYDPYRAVIFGLVFSTLLNAGTTKWHMLR